MKTGYQGRRYIILSQRLLLIFLIFIIVLPACTQSNVTSIAGSNQSDLNNDPRNPPNTCPVTKTSDPPFTPPEQYPDNPPEQNFWYGSASLWTAIPSNGVWYDLPHNSEGYSQKVFWWRDGYSVTEEPEPALIVTGRRLDADAPTLQSSKATNAYGGDLGSASMLVGVDFPTLGCWEITGQYADASLTFVVWVAP